MARFILSFLDGLSKAIAPRAWAQASGTFAYRFASVYSWHEDDASCLRTAMTTLQLSGEDDVLARARQALASTPIPKEVRTAIQARIDASPGAFREICRPPWPRGAPTPGSSFESTRRKPCPRLTSRPT